MAKPDPDRYKIEQFAKRFQLCFEVGVETQYFLVNEFTLWPPENPENIQPGKWSLDYGVEIPATRWEPPDVDVVEVGSFDTLDEALLKMLEVIGKNELSEGCLVYEMTPETEFYV